MANSERDDYEKDKTISAGKTDLLPKAGGKSGSSGPTSSSTSYPKGGKPSLSPNELWPGKDREGWTYAVGGV
jgi:hypothetical protein